LSKVFEYGSFRRIRDATRLSTRYKLVALVAVEVPEQSQRALVAEAFRYSQVHVKTTRTSCHVYGYGCNKSQMDGMKKKMVGCGNRVYLIIDEASI